MLNLNFKTSKLTAHHKLIHLSSELLKYKIDYLTVQVKKKNKHDQNLRKKIGNGLRFLKERVG